MIRAFAPYTSGWGSFVLLKMDRVRVARGGSLSTLHRHSAITVYVSCICDPVISVRVLHLLHNNSVDYS